MCVGIDPVWERLPRSVQRAAELGEGTTFAARSAAGLLGFSRGVLDAVTPHVACVKVQSACFERYFAEGVRACRTLVAEAASRGLVVILDAKRGDIGVSAEHYAAGCLADPPGAGAGAARESGADDVDAGPDALTVNAYLGADGLTPFLSVAREQGKGLFALVRTSNPGGDAVQALTLADGRTVADAVAEMIAGLGDAEGCVGESGYSLLGAVVGATKPADAARLRELMPRQVFLVPGFGAQGATADDVRPCFAPDGSGAIIAASRSVLFAYEKTGTEDWRGAIEAAAVEMKHQVGGILAR